MVSLLRPMSLTEFRADASAQVAWVAHMGGHVWIRKHGKVVAGVVPFYQLRMLDALDYGTTDPEVKRRMLEREYAAWKRAVALKPEPVREAPPPIDPERADMMALYERRRRARLGLE